MGSEVGAGPGSRDLQNQRARFQSLGRSSAQRPGAGPSQGMDRARSRESSGGSHLSTEAKAGNRTKLELGRPGQKLGQEPQGWEAGATDEVGRSPRPRQGLGPRPRSWEAGASVALRGAEGRGSSSRQALGAIVPPQHGAQPALVVPSATTQKLRRTAQAGSALREVAAGEASQRHWPGRGGQAASVSAWGSHSRR